MKKIIRYTIVYPIIIYILLLTSLFASQKSMVYIPSDIPFENCTTFKENEQKTYKGTRFYEQKGKNDDVIVFFHGNAGRACDRSFMKNQLEKTNNSIIFVEYYGYSDNNSPNKKSILNDVNNIGEYIKTSNQYKNIYVLGRSIGTGPASYFAGNFKTNKLLLISPYSSLYKIGADKYPIFPIKYMFSENYESEKYLSNYQNDFLIIHGKEDTTIPTKYGIELYDSLTSVNKNIMLVENLGHNDIFSSEDVNRRMIEFLQ